MFTLTVIQASIKIIDNQTEAHYNISKHSPKQVAAITLNWNKFTIEVEQSEVITVEDRTKSGVLSKARAELKKATSSNVVAIVDPLVVKSGNITTVADKLYQTLL